MSFHKKIIAGFIRMPGNCGWEENTKQFSCKNMQIKIAAIM